MLYIDISTDSVRFADAVAPSPDDKIYPKNLEAVKDESDLIWVQDETWTENIVNGYSPEDITLNGVVYATSAEVVQNFNLLILNT